MKVGTALFAFVLAIPALCICGVCTYWALTSSGWWLLGSAAATAPLPEMSSSVAAAPRASETKNG